MDDMTVEFSVEYLCKAMNVVDALNSRGYMQFDQSVQTLVDIAMLLSREESARDFCRHSDELMTALEEIKKELHNIYLDLPA